MFWHVYERPWQIDAIAILRLFDLIYAYQIDFSAIFLFLEFHFLREEVIFLFVEHLWFPRKKQNKCFVN